MNRKYQLKAICIKDRFPKFCVWCARNDFIPSISMDETEIEFMALSKSENCKLCVIYPVYDFDFYGADNMSQIVIEDMERIK